MQDATTPTASMLRGLGAAVHKLIGPESAQPAQAPPLTAATPSLVAQPRRCGVRSSAPPLAAFVLVGHPRTFVKSTVHEHLLRHAIKDFEAQAYTFLLLSADDHGSSKGHAVARSTDDAVGAAVARFRPKAFRYERVDAAQPSIPADCDLESTRHRVGDYASQQCSASQKHSCWLVGWWQTWERLRRAFALVREYEEAHSLRFDWIVRLRPDAWFFGPGPAHCELSRSEGIVTPAGVAGCSRQCLNDHLAWIPRAHADAFFNATSELEQCHDGAFRKRMIDYGYFLRERLQRAGVPIANVRRVPYTIARPCDAFSRNGSAYADCGRIKQSLTIARGHPGMQNVPQSAFEAMYAQCVARWPEWPPGIAGYGRGSFKGSEC